MTNGVEFNSRRSGFTLAEMLAVVAIIGILAAVTVGATFKHRNTAWEQKARDTTRQIAQAWTLYLVDFREFPSDIAKLDDNEAKGKAIEYIAPIEYETDEDRLKNKKYEYDDDYHGKVYLEITDSEREKGLKDHWGEIFHFALDGDYDSKLKSPAPSASHLKDDYVSGSAIAWTRGRTPGSLKTWIVEWK